LEAHQPTDPYYGDFVSPDEVANGSGSAAKNFRHLALVAKPPRVFFNMTIICHVMTIGDLTGSGYVGNWRINIQLL
jgi:hypothetical protein